MIYLTMTQIPLKRSSISNKAMVVQDACPLSLTQMVAADGLLIERTLLNQDSIEPLSPTSPYQKE